MSMNLIWQNFSAVGPGFPTGNANPKPIFGENLPENCMKTKKILPKIGRGQRIQNLSV